MSTVCIPLHSLPHGTVGLTYSVHDCGGFESRCRAAMGEGKGPRCRCSPPTSLRCVTVTTPGTLPLPLPRHRPPTQSETPTQSCMKWFSELSEGTRSKSIQTGACEQHTHVSNSQQSAAVLLLLLSYKRNKNIFLAPYLIKYKRRLESKSPLLYK